MLKKLVSCIVALSIVLCVFGIPVNAAGTIDVVNVKDCGAVGDGINDDTAAFQSAISQSSTQGKPVYVPRGIYKITQTLQLTNQSMIGDDSASWSGDDVTMPVIKPTNPANSGIRLNNGGAISGISFDYAQDEQGTPTQYAPTILLAGVGTRVSNVKIFHAWIGIDCYDDGIDNTGRSSLENVFISRVAYVGIELDYGWDVTSLNNVEVWTPSTCYDGYFFNYGTGIKLQHNDLIRIENTFVYGANIGILLEDNGSGGTWGNMTNTSTDFCKYGMKFVGSNKLTIAGGTHRAHFTALYIGTVYTELRITAAELQSNGGDTVLISDCRRITITGCTIDRPQSGYTKAAIRIVRGWNVVVTGNYINSNGGPGVKIESGTQRAVVTNNIIGVASGDTHIINSGVTTIVNNNLLAQ